LNPKATKYLYAYGCVLVQLDSRRQAAEVFEQWLQADPQNPIARHLSAAALGSQSISKASPGYVRALFDQYASHFDENLARLRYCGPELVLRALTHLGTVATGGWKVLDAGCGTGLVGAALRPLASELIGVDLSTVMLDVARRRMIYDDLVCSDIVDYFRERFQEFDVIAAADLLTYIGDLREFFEHAAHALRPGGFVVALAESLKTAEDYRLNPTGRFCHSREYLHQVMSSAGLTVPYFEEDAMRHESKKPISTWVAVGTLARV
jgi:predicted TPR repeat methyltransferase